MISFGKLSEQEEALKFHLISKGKEIKYWKKFRQHQGQGSVSHSLTSTTSLPEAILDSRDAADFCLVVSNSI